MAGQVWGGGYYDANNHWVPSTVTGAGYYDASGRWVDYDPKADTGTGWGPLGNPDGLDTGDAMGFYGQRTPPPPPGPPPPDVTPPPPDERNNNQQQGSIGSNLYPTLGTPPPGFQLGPVPVFTPPTYTKPNAFTATTAADMKADPGYEFRLSEGERALQQSQAAQGVINGGGSLKSILDYGQNYASNEFGSVDTRRRNDYSTNYQTQYVDPYKFAYQSALDQFAPRMTEYAAQAQVGLHNADTSNQNFWNDYYAQVGKQGTTFDQQFKTVTA